MHSSSNKDSLPCLSMRVLPVPAFRGSVGQRLRERLPPSIRNPDARMSQLPLENCHSRADNAQSLRERGPADRSQHSTRHNYLCQTVREPEAAPELFGEHSLHHRPKAFLWQLPCMPNSCSITAFHPSVEWSSMLLPYLPHEPGLPQCLPMPFLVNPHSALEWRGQPPRHRKCLHGQPWLLQCNVWQLLAGMYRASIQLY